ncbi:MAG: endolytic transglycosylase MltG [Gemmatimonadetes bacterium]|nr:endolytic transglycosylase MltG [Gemmatimonadota bacterium]
MKGIGVWIAVIAGAALVAWLGAQALLATPPATPGDSPVTIRVAKGEGLAPVARRLEEEGLVVSARRFRLLARLTGRDRAIRAGTYEFLPGLDPRDLLARLEEGKVRLLRLTVPEGRRLLDIAKDVESALGVPAEEVIAAASDPARVTGVGARGENLEGYLFPETYFFEDGVSAGDVVDGMVARFEAEWGELADLPQPEGLDRHDVVTLASIVEAETPLADEKPRVAAVYLNRLHRGMRLQADPTVRYGIGRFDGRLYYKHLDIESAYNTYQNQGLPPGPIGSPGRAALRAVLEPLTPCDDLYFVASGNGGHVFSRTKAEHDRAVAEARKRRDAAARDSG